MIALLLLLQQAPTPSSPMPPRREISDPGVIATDQRVTPAGVQSVFTDRVFGVRFGAKPGEIWVSIHGAAYRLGWRENAVLGSAAFDGRAGVQGIAIDPLNGRALITSVGRLPADIALSRTPGSDSLAHTKSVAHFTAYDGDSMVVRMTSPALGDYIVGAPAVARRANASGHRVVVVPLSANDSLAVLDADSGTLLKKIALGVLPVAAVVSGDGSLAYVSNLGGPKPGPTDRTAKQCCDPFAELVRVDQRGRAEAGSVMRVDLIAGTVTKVYPVGRHPTGMVWDEKTSRLFVADGNSDAVSVIDTRREAVIRTLAIVPFRERKFGLAPTAVALSPDAATLYVTLGGVNAVAVYSIPRGQLRGLIPTGWYPTNVDVSADGRTLAVGTLFGVGSGIGHTVGKTGRYVHSYRGSVNVIDVPTDAQLAAYTTSVAQNNRLTLGQPLATPAPAAKPAARAVPERPGDSSFVQHVVYIIRENRTFDQVFGDIGKGESDSAALQYGRDVTPNAHALAEQFVLLDHFFASGGNSADGHNWLTQGVETEYPMWPLYTGRSYPSEGSDPLAYSSGGFLWEAAASKGKTVQVFGEYAPGPPTDSDSLRRALLARFSESGGRDNGEYFRAEFSKRYHTGSNIRSLDGVLVREYPGWTMEVPDVAKAEVFLEHLREWEDRGQMPNLVMMNLPSDHTNGMSPGWCAPKACVADNDLALGKIVEGLSHSRFWKSMAILIVEDDAQNGVDHIDGHRTVALVASPYAKRGVIDPTFYSQPSMVKTIELMLGLPAMSLFDLVATDMRASFIGPNETPNPAPYAAVVPQQSLLDVNQQVGMITGPHAVERRQAAAASARMNFRDPDAAPTERLNRILWHDARGWATPYPEVKRSLFFPMAVDVEDEDRKEKAPRK